MSEGQRGCGYRKIGGLYLASDLGQQLVCDGLPLPLDPCGCCGFEPFPTRGLQRLRAGYIQFLSDRKHEDLYSTKCSCPPACPICFPWGNADKEENLILGLMYVGASFYTPESFIKEAIEMGVSKRIPEIPSWMVLGKTWIFLAQRDVPMVNGKGTYELDGLAVKEPKKTPAIFYGFKPQRVEMPLWKGSVTDEEIQILERHGVTPILLDPSPKNRELHEDAKVNFRSLIEQWRKEEAEEEKKKKKIPIAKKPKEPAP